MVLLLVLKAFCSKKCHFALNCIEINQKWIQNISLRKYGNINVLPEILLVYSV